MKQVTGTTAVVLMFAVVLAAGMAGVVTTAEGATVGDGNGEPALTESDDDGETTEPVAAPVSSVEGTVEPSDTVAVQGITVHKSIAEAVDALLDAARSDGVVLSGWGYRSHQRQIELRIAHCGGNNHYAIWERPSSQCSPPTATPGRSQHEKGLAIDFSDCPWGSSCFAWLSANASTYGLFNLPSESWHWSTTGN